MMKQRFGQTTMVLALLAVAAFMPMKAWAVDVSAPQTSATIHLGVNDPPSIAKLNGWYCSSTDLRKTVREMLKRVARSTNPNEAASDLIALFSVYDGKGWPYESMLKNPLKMGLDAPPGGSKVHNFKCCYTKSELDLIAKKTELALKAVYNMKGAKAAWGEVSNWSGFEGILPETNELVGEF